MMEGSLPPNTENEELYVDLGEVGSGTVVRSQLIERVRTWQSELVQLHSSNEKLLKDNEDEEKLIQEWIEKLNHKSVD